MFDSHYDLLTVVLMYKYKKEWLKEYFKQVFNNENITGGIFNLFYMTYEEMKQELGMEKSEINVIQNLTDVKEFITLNKIIPQRS